MADAASLAVKIEAHDAAVVSELSALTDCCLVDSKNRTLFDAAILANNAEVIALLATDKNVLEFAAPVDPANQTSIKHAAAAHDVEVPISKLEGYLKGSYGDDMPFGRTPLHTACRAGNASATEALLIAGASTKAKDVIGLTPAELAFYAGGEEGLGQFLSAFESSGQTNLPVGKRLLRETFAFPVRLEDLLNVAKLDAYARRLLFCYRCAWLDVDAVRELLANGHDPNKGLTAEINPLWEVCTSALLWDETIPGGFEAAFHYTKHAGHPGASAVSFDNALLNEDGSNFGQLFAEAQRKQKAQIKVVEQMTIDPDEEQRVLRLRIELLGVLLDAGADVALAKKKLEFDSFSDLKQMGLNEVAEYLKQRRSGATKPVKKNKPSASTSWDLVYETGLNTEYWADQSEGGQLRLILHNVYGPVDGLELSVLLTRDASKPDGDWKTLKPSTETVEVDGEAVSRADLTEPVYGESPWEAIYELPLQQTPDARVLWIRLDHAESEELRGELDPWTFKG